MPLTHAGTGNRAQFFTLCRRKRPKGTNQGIGIESLKAQLARCSIDQFLLRKALQVNFTSLQLLAQLHADTLEKKTQKSIRPIPE